jgi:flagellar biosynthesis protein FlhG
MIEFLFGENQRSMPSVVQEFALHRPTRARRSKRLSPAPVFAISSGKGGVGKSIVVANLAAALLQRNKRVMAIDADLGLANLHLFLGVNPIYTLADFFSGAATLKEIIVSNRNGILLLPGATGIQELTALRHDQKAALLTELDLMSHAVDLVLVDTGSGISDAVTYFTSAAQEIVVVVTPEPSSMHDSYGLLKVLTSRHGQKRFWILPNSVSGKEEALHLFDTLSRVALRFLNASLDLLGWIPRDPQLRRSVARAQIVVLSAPDSPAARSFAALAERLVEITTAGVNLKGNLQFFFRRMLDSERGVS